MARQKLQISDLLIRDSASRNPYASKPDQGFIQNFAPDYGMLRRVPFMPPFHTSASSSRVWHMVDFQFQRDLARNQQLLIFKADGKVYKRQAGRELEIFPGKTSFAAFVQKPAYVNLADRLHVSDGSQYLIYDGWDWFTGGLVAPAAPAVALVAGSLTGTYKVAVTAVHIRNGVRIHESSRSAAVSNVPAAQNIRVTQPTLDARATHWSVYMSELSTSDVYRRVATVQIGSTTTDISAVPASTSPTAPIRNDPPQPSRVMTLWKNRIAMRDEQALSNLWFTAFAEVKGLINGAPEESLCGRGSASISDIVNSWTLPDSGEPIQGAVWHEEFLWVFSDRNGYVVKGEGSLLDSRGLRDFFPQHIFTLGLASPWGALSSPFGLIMMSQDRKLWLWDGSSETVDIGIDIQKRLNLLTPTQLSEMNMWYWEGGGNTWLVIPFSDRLEIFDFSVRTEDSPKGVWFSIAGFSDVPTTVGEMTLSGQKSLLVGLNDGSVVQVDNDYTRSVTVRQPAHLNLSMILGNTYLGATPQNSPSATVRTGGYPPQAGSWVEGMYMEIVHRGTGDTSATGIRGIEPTVTFFNDEIDPNNPVGANVLTLAPVGTTNPSAAVSEKRGWLFTAIHQSCAGKLGKRFQLQLDYATTANDGQARKQVINDEILQLGFTWIPRGDLAL